MNQDLYPEQFHNHHMHVEKPEGVRYLDVDDIPDSWHKLNEEKLMESKAEKTVAM